MARIETDPNYTSPTFSRATAATDIFKKEDVQALAAAMSTHDHSTGKGLVLSAGSIPAGSITSAMIADGTIVAGDIADGSITSAKIADGTIATADIAPTAISQTIGSYGPTTPTFSSTTVVTWLNTPLTVTGTCGGSPVRVFGFLTWSHSASGSAVDVALAVDGALSVSFARDYAPFAAAATSVSFDVIVTPTVGSHTFTIQIYNFNAGTVSIGLVNAYLAVVEVKR